MGSRLAEQEGPWLEAAAAVVRAPGGYARCARCACMALALRRRGAY